MPDVTSHLAADEVASIERVIAILNVELGRVPESSTADWLREQRDELRFRLAQFASGAEG